MITRSKMSNKQLREQREFQTLFNNPRGARQAWSQEITQRLAKPAMEPIAIYDSKGNLTQESQVEQAVWLHLLNELKEEGLERLPTEGEFMEACQQYYARHNPAAYVARRDTAGAKPIDETKQTIQIANPLDGLSDEELLVMQRALEDYHAQLDDKKETVKLNEYSEGEKAREQYNYLREYKNGSGDYTPEYVNAVSSCDGTESFSAVEEQDDNATIES